VRTEELGYVASRSELLCGVFLLSSLLAFRRGFSISTPQVGSVALAAEAKPESANRLGDWRWLAIAMVSFAVALGPKETAAMLPLVLIAYDRLLRLDPPAVKRA